MRRIRVDLNQRVGDVVLFRPQASEDFEVGDELWVYDLDTADHPATVQEAAPGTVTLLVDFSRGLPNDHLEAGHVFDVELSPPVRETGVYYLDSIYLDPGQTLAPGDEVQLRDEGGYPYRAVVESVRETRFGQSYRLVIHGDARVLRKSSSASAVAPMQGPRPIT